MLLTSVDEPTAAQAARLKVQELPVRAVRSSASGHQGGGGALIHSFIYLPVTDSGVIFVFNLVCLFQIGLISHKRPNLHPNILSADPKTS